METGIGSILRETRNRRKVELSEVEAATKIRVRYLRAMENEDWDVLPGGAYTRGFIRTYASYLGLDGDRLSEDYRAGIPPSAIERAPRVEPMASGTPAPRSRLPSWIWIALASVILAAILVGVGLAGGGDNGGQTPAGGEAGQPEARAGADRQEAASRPSVAVLVEAKGEVWVCMVDAVGEPVISGQILEAGDERGPYRGNGFSVAFGNGEVGIRIDGRRAEIPASSSPIGFEIGADGKLAELEEGERPDCE